MDSQTMSDTRRNINQASVSQLLELLWQIWDILNRRLRFAEGPSRCRHQCQWCENRCCYHSHKRTIPLPLLSLSLSLSLVSACTSAVLQCTHVMSQLHHIFRQIIVLEKTPVILACPAQPATILPAHTHARPTFAAPITLATLRISRCQQTQRVTMIRTLQSYHATATMSPRSQDLQAQTHRPCHVRARHQSRYHQRSADSG